MNILVVDDTPAILNLLEIVLQQRGHQVTSCADAESALEVYTHTAPELVVLDWMLPGMSGVELCRTIRALPGSDSTVIMMFTARDDNDSLLEALEAGANDYYSKPVDLQRLNVRLTILERQVEVLQERRRAKLDLELALEAAQSHQENLASILNQLCLGTVLTDESGKVLFISRAAEEIFALDGEAAVGNHWGQVFPFREEDMARILAESKLPAEQRQRLSLHLRTETQRYWIDVMVQDHYQLPERKVFIFYDMTEMHSLREQLDGKAQYHDLVGKSRPMMQVYQQIQEIAAVDITVLIEGETGTGKELVARAVHAASGRRDRPFVAINCAGLTESLLTSQLFGHRKGAFTGALNDHKGVFEEADGGTLFLDEIGEISMNVQTALLRVLQEREVTRVGENTPRKVDVRLVSATNRDLNAEVEAGNFRADLMYRIRVARIALPPLRERREDIPLLSNVFLTRFRAASGKDVRELDTDAIRLLTDYHWPGNVRELENTIEVAAVRSRDGTIRAADLPLEFQPRAGTAPAPPATAPLSPTPQPPGVTPVSDVLPLAGDERQRILTALAYSNGNRKEAARLLGISRATLYRRLEKLGIDAG